MCDMIVAAEGTVMGLIETVRASIPAGGGTQLLPRLIGPARAKELIFTGRKFKAEEALAWGMLNYVVPEDRLEARTLELAREITAAAPVSCTQAKRAINSGMDTDFATGVQIEAALYEHPAVKEAAVIGIPSEKWGEEVKAVVALEPGKTLTADELISFARAHIAGYKVPKSVDFVPELPRNGTGKLMKHVLRDPYWAGRERQVS